MDGQETQIYNDIINLEHHEITTRARMPRENRAASFAPFAALTGYEEAVNETARFTDCKIELDEGAKAVLNQKLQLVIENASKGPQITVTYFLPDKKKQGGSYVQFAGVVKRVDMFERIVIFADRSFVPIDDIFAIEGEIYKDLL